MTPDDPSGHAESQYTDFGPPIRARNLSQVAPRRYTLPLCQKRHP